MKIPKIILRRENNYILIYEYDEKSEIAKTDFELVYMLKSAVPIIKIESLPNFAPVFIYNRSKLLEAYNIININDGIMNMTGLKWGDLRKELSNPFIIAQAINAGKSIEVVMKDERTQIKVAIDHEYYNFLLDIIDTLYFKCINCKSMVSYVDLIKGLFHLNLLFDINKKVINSIIETLDIYIELLEGFGVKIIKSRMKPLDDSCQDISLPNFADTLGMLLTLEMESLSNLEVDDNESDTIDKIKCLFMSVYAFAFGILARGIIGQGE